jgi:hypothetical protein
VTLEEAMRLAISDGDRIYLRAATPGLTNPKRGSEDG